MISVDLMSLWAFVCSVHLCPSVRNRTLPLDEIRPMRFAGEFFSHRAHGGHGGFKHTVSSPQNTSGIQSSQRPFN